MEFIIEFLQGCYRIDKCPWQDGRLYILHQNLAPFCFDPQASGNTRYLDELGLFGSFQAEPKGSSRNINKL